MDNAAVAEANSDSWISLSSSAKFALAYAAIATTWILVSDGAIGLLIDDPQQMAVVGALKGWAFVALSAFMLYGMMKHKVRDMTAMHEKVTREKDAKAQALQLLDIVAERSTDAIYIKDISGRYLLFNRYAGHFVGKDSASVIGLDDRAVFPPEEAEALIEADRRLMEQGETRTIEEVMTTSLGVRTFLSTKGPLYDHHGLIGLFGIARDITERKQDEEKLRWLSEAVRQSTAAIVVSDQRQHIQYANPAYECLFGYSQAELQGQSQSILLPDDPALREANSVEPGYFEGEKLRQTKDGRNIPVLVKSAPIVDANGATIGYVTAKTDLSQLKAAENKAEAANRAKSDFLATMSHEIRTPMNGVIGLTHLALMGDLAPKQREYIEGIGQSAQHLLAIINDLLDLSKIEAKRIELEDVPFDLALVVDGTVAMVKNEAAAKGLTVSVQIAPVVPRKLVGDPLRIRQMLLNYLNNAVKFTQQGGITVRVETDVAIHDDVLLRIFVTDTGVGLAPEQQANLFKPFQQADISVTRKFGGTGLGLSIAKRLAELMGGEVGVESAIGHGSTFWLTARVRRSAESESVSPTQAADRQTLATRPGAGAKDYSILRGVRVLLVDDDPTNRMVGVGLLSIMGMDVDVAGDGGESVEKAVAKNYEIVLMDMKMRNMDGVTATRLIREREALADLPIIAMTANALNAQKEECRAAGMNDFIGKPVAPSELYAVIHKWVMWSRESSSNMK